MMVDELEGLLENQTTASIFLYLRNLNGGAGVRQIQRDLNLNNPSTVYWHLNKLKEVDVVAQSSDNSYYLEDQYKNITKLHLPVKLPFYVFGSQLFPDLISILVFLLLTSVIMVVLFITGQYLIVSIIGILAVIVTMIMIYRFYRHIHHNLSKPDE